MASRIPQTPKNSPDLRPAGAPGYEPATIVSTQAGSAPASPDQRARTTQAAASPMSSFGLAFAGAMALPAGDSPAGSPASNSSGGGGRKRKASADELDERSPFRRKVGEGRMLVEEFAPQEGPAVRRLDETSFGAGAGSGAGSAARSVAGSRRSAGAGLPRENVQTALAQSPRGSLAGSPASSEPSSPVRGAGSAASRMMSGVSLFGFDDDAAMALGDNLAAASPTNAHPSLTWAPVRSVVPKQERPLRLTTEALALASLNNSDDDDSDDNEMGVETARPLLPPVLPARPRRLQLDFGSEPAAQRGAASEGVPLETLLADTFQFAMPASPAKKTAAAGSGSSSPLSSKEKYERKAEAPVQTPPKVSAAIAALKGAKLTAALPPTEQTKVRMGMVALQRLGDGSPRSAEKAKDLASRVERTVYDKMAGSGSEKADTPDYHMAGIEAFHKVKWARGEVFDPIDQARRNMAAKGAGSGAGAGAGVPKSGAGLGEAAPLRLFDARHLTSAEKRGEKSVGLHIIPDNFDDLYAWVSGTKQVSATTGVVTGRYIVKAEKNSIPKSTSCFPPAISTFEQLMKIANKTPELAAKDNRRLVVIDLPGSGLGAGAGAGTSGAKMYAEMYLGSKDGRLVKSFFPFFAFFTYTSGQTYRLTSEISYSSDILFQWARKELGNFDPYYESKGDKSHLSYVVKKKGGGADFIFDLAAQSNVIDKGLMLCISSDAFAADDNLKHRAAMIIERWDDGGDSDSD